MTLFAVASRLSHSSLGRLSGLTTSSNIAKTNLAVIGVLSRFMGTIAEGVEFDTIAREWRCKWSSDNDKQSLVQAQKILNEVLPRLKGMEGAKVQRIVCGGCLDFKIITALPASKFGDWDSDKFAPEGEVLEKLKAVEGLSQIETQTYTLMTM